MRRVIKQFKISATRNSYCNHRLVCRILSWWNRTPFVSFPGHSQNVSGTTFQSTEFLIRVYLVEYNAASKVEVNACKVSFPWHNSFLVSLWTFQPTLVRLYIAAISYSFVFCSIPVLHRIEWSDHMLLKWFVHNCFSDSLKDFLHLWDEKSVISL